MQQDEDDVKVEENGVRVEEGGVKVAVVGAGIAGLTAALELAKRGYEVTVYERDETIGGNLSSERVCHREGDDRDDREVCVDHDVYPHMFAGWYRNFWRLLEQDLGLSREGNFERRDGVKALRKGSRDYTELPYPTNLHAAWKFMTAGYIPLPDVFAYGYAMVDLATKRFDPDELLSRYSLNGFMNSRGYTTERAAEFLDLAVMEIWSLYGYQTSAWAYRDFVRRAYSLGTDQPFAWVLKGSLWKKLIHPLVDKLDDYADHYRDGKHVVRTGHTVEKISVGARKVDLKIRTSKRVLDKSFDYLVLAVDPAALGGLIQAADRGPCLVDRIPALSEVRRLRAEPIPVVDLYFNRELADIPMEHVGLCASKMKLSFVQISGLWEDDPEMQGRTALVLAASDFYALPIAVGQDLPAALGLKVEKASKEKLLEGLHKQLLEDGHQMIRELHEYLPVFKPGAYWGDDSSDIDWDRTKFIPNLKHRLFINDVGSGQWGPSTRYQECPNVFFAGDYCRNEVAMATVEAAVLSGLKAAEALWRKCPRGDPIEIIENATPNQSKLLATKLALSANAYWARWFSLAYDCIEPVSRGDLSGLPQKAAQMLYLPYAFGGEVVTTTYELLSSLVMGKRGPDDD